MTKGRKPRKPRTINLNAFGAVLYRVGRLTEPEVREAITPAQTCLAKLREGVATEDQHTVLATSLLLALEIERSGIVRGLQEHLASARAALDAIRARALASGVWRATPLYFFELQALQDAVELHEFQLRQLSAGELNTAVNRLIARTRSTGGQLVRTSAELLCAGAA